MVFDRFVGFAAKSMFLKVSEWETGFETPRIRICDPIWIANGVVTFQNGHRQVKLRNGESSVGEISVWSVLKVLMGNVFRDEASSNCDLF